MWDFPSDNINLSDIRGDISDCDSAGIAVVDHLAHWPNMMAVESV